MRSSPLVVAAVALRAGAQRRRRLPAAPAPKDLPPRTSPTDYPVAVLHAAGDDLPPVVGEVEWLGGDEPVATVAPRAVNLQRFTVLQVRGAG